MRIILASLAAAIALAMAACSTTTAVVTRPDGTRIAMHDGMVACREAARTIRLSQAPDGSPVFVKMDADFRGEGPWTVLIWGAAAKGLESIANSEAASDLVEVMK